MDMTESMPEPSSTTLEAMMKCVARFAELRGSEEAFVDSRLPGCRRRKINIVGSGVTERTDLPDLAPNIALPAHRFSLGMIQCDPGNGTALHRHRTEEVFMPLVAPWAIACITALRQNEGGLQPLRPIHVPVA